MGAVIASALKSAILGAASTPLKLLGGSFGGKSGNGPGTFTITPIKSPAGSPDLDSSSSGRIDGLVKLLAQRPTIGLILSGRTSTDDRPSVAEQLLVERVEQGKGLPELDGAGFLARLRIKQILSLRSKGKSSCREGQEDARCQGSQCGTAEYWKSRGHWGSRSGHFVPASAGCICGIKMNRIQEQTQFAPS